MTARDSETLKAFQDWFFSPGGPGVGYIPLHAPTHDKAGLTTITLYRRNGYQVELVLVPPGQDYDLHVPEDTPMSLVFLGGSFDYGDCSFAGLESTSPNRISSPDSYREDAAHLIKHMDPLERPHPVRLLQRPDPFIPLSTGGHGVFRATDEKGIVLIFGLYGTDRAHTVLDHIRCVPPS